MLRKYLKNHIETNVPNKNVAVLMGGGVDAISVALSAHDVGKVVHVYSFHLEGHESYDYLKAKEISQYMDWRFIGVSVPKTNIIEDWYRLVKLKCRKKDTL